MEINEIKTKGRFAREIGPYILGVLLALAALFLIRWGFLCPGYEYEPDCFYHARIVEEGPSVFMAKKFPTLISSSWTEHFSDKELGFHLILWAVTRVGKLFGATNEYPFHYQAMFFNFLLLTSIAIALYRQKTKHPWLYMLIFICMFPGMTYRLVSLRAYLLSMTLETVMLIMLLEERFRTWKWRYVALCGMGFIASWSYSSPHLLLTTLVPFAIADFLKDRNWKALIAMPGAFILGIILGLTIHPQFPNTFLMFKVQCIDVVLAFIFQIKKIPIEGGDEFYASTFHYIEDHCYLYFGVMLAIVALALKYGNILFGRQWQKNNVFNGLVLATALNTLLSFKIFRFCEYSIVPQCLLLAYMVNKVLESNETSSTTEPSSPQQEEAAAKPTCSKRPRLLFHTLLAYMLICLVEMFWNASCLFSPGMGEIPSMGVAQWAEYNKIPEGTVIANFMWSDFPKLYYALPKYRFNWGLDPAFTWQSSPELILFQRRARKREHLTPEDFKKAYKAKYLYVHILQYEAAKCCWQNGLTPIYQNWDGWIFDLDLPQRKITPETPKLMFLDLIEQGGGAPYVMQYIIENMQNYYGVPIEKK